MNNLYLITGEEEYDKCKCLESIKSSFDKLEKGINYIILDKNTISNLEDEVNTFPFGYEKKLIIIKLDKKSSKEEDDESKKQDNLFTILEKIVDDLNENFYIVVIGDYNSKSKVYKLIQKYGKCFEFKTSNDAEIMKFGAELFKENETTISNSDLAYLVNLCGNDKLNLKNEIEKLVNYSKVIKKDDIDKLCIKNSDVIIFDLTDNLGSKNVKKALNCLEELIYNKEPIQKIAIMIEKHFKSLLVAKIAVGEGKNVLNELNTNSSYAANKYKEQSRHFEKNELISIIKKLSKLDIDSKKGKIDLKIGLEKIICEF